MGHLIVGSLTQAYWGLFPIINLTGAIIISCTRVTWFYNKLHNKASTLLLSIDEHFVTYEIYQTIEYLQNFVRCNTDA